MASKKNSMNMADAIKTVTVRSTDPVMDKSKRGRPKNEGKATAKLVSFRFPPELLDELDTWLGTRNPENKNRTEVVIEAVKKYIQ